MKEVILHVLLEQNILDCIYSKKLYNGFISEILLFTKLITKINLYLSFLICKIKVIICLEN